MKSIITVLLTSYTAGVCSKRGSLLALDWSTMHGYVRADKESHRKQTCADDNAASATASPKRL